MNFSVVSIQSEAGKKEAKAYDFGHTMHGLVGFDRKGNHKVTLPGHMFGRDEIVAQIKVVQR